MWKLDYAHELNLECCEEQLHTGVVIPRAFAKASNSA